MGEESDLTALISFCKGLTAVEKKKKDAGYTPCYPKQNRARCCKTVREAFFLFCHKITLFRGQTNVKDRLFFFSSDIKPATTEKGVHLSFCKFKLQ